MKLISSFEYVQVIHQFSTFATVATTSRICHGGLRQQVYTRETQEYWSTGQDEIVQAQNLTRGEHNFKKAFGIPRDRVRLVPELIDLFADSHTWLTARTIPSLL